MADVEAIGKRFKLLEGLLNEKLRRLVAAAEAEAIGRGGASIVSRATGVSRRAIRVGAQELNETDESATGRIRRRGRWAQADGGEGPDAGEGPGEPGRAYGRAAIRSRRCAGRARACVGWRWS